MAPLAWKPSAPGRHVLAAEARGFGRSAVAQGDHTARRTRSLVGRCRSEVGRVATASVSHGQQTSIRRLLTRLERDLRGVGGGNAPAWNIAELCFRDRIDRLSRLHRNDVGRIVVRVPMCRRLRQGAGTSQHGKRCDQRQKCIRVHDCGSVLIFSIGSR